MTNKKTIFAVAIIPALIVGIVINSLKQPITRRIETSPNIQITTSKDTEMAKQERILAEFFKRNKSPLELHSGKFIEIADKYDIDYRLLPAISCTESSCGKFLIPSSHNPFGWGIYGNVVTSYISYEQAIEKVGEGLSRGYISKGLTTPERIGPKYNPVSYKAWSGHTRFFMNQIDEIAFSLK